MPMPGAIRTLTAHSTDGSMWPSLIDGAAAYTLEDAGTYNGQTLSWLKVNTSAFDGKVVQMAVVSVDAMGTNGGSSYSGTACYLTDAGSVYCSDERPQVAAPSVYDSSQRKYVGAVQQVEAGSYNGSTYYWIKVDTYWIKVDTDAMNISGTTAGTTITLTGNNLSKVTNVYIDANNNSALDEGIDMAVSNLKIISDTQLTFTAPSMSPGTYNLIITNPGNVVVKGTLTYR